MKICDYFNDMEIIKDPSNPFSYCLKGANNHLIYIEPMFENQVNLILLHHPDCLDKIVAEMKRISTLNEIVIFAGDEENIITKKDGAIELTIYDILDKLQIFVEDKSRGSDYGD